MEQRLNYLQSVFRAWSTLTSATNLDSERRWEWSEKHTCCSIGNWYKRTGSLGLSDATGGCGACGHCTRRLMVFVRSALEWNRATFWLGILAMWCHVVHLCQCWKVGKRAKELENEKVRSIWWDFWSVLCHLCELRNYQLSENWSPVLTSRHPSSISRKDCKRSRPEKVQTCLWFDGHVCTHAFCRFGQVITISCNFCKLQLYSKYTFKQQNEKTYLAVAEASKPMISAGRSPQRSRGRGPVPTVYRVSGVNTCCLCTMPILSKISCCQIFLHSDHFVLALLWSWWYQFQVCSMKPFRLVTLSWGNPISGRRRTAVLKYVAMLANGSAAIN